MNADVVYETLVVADEPLTLSAIAQALDCAKNTADKYLKQLEARDLVERRSHGRSFVFECVHNADQSFSDDDGYEDPTNVVEMIEEASEGVRVCLHGIIEDLQPLAPLGSPVVAKAISDLSQLATSLDKRFEIAVSTLNDLDPLRESREDAFREALESIIAQAKETLDA